jgi:TatD DNase family protein
MWTDSHSHLQERYVSRPEGDAASSSTREWEAGVGRHSLEIDAALERAHEAGVSRIVVVGTDIETSREAVEMVRDHRGPVSLACAVGIHPHGATAGTHELAQLLAESSEFISGVGECGLDYYYEHSPRDVQRRVFAEHIALATQYDKALVIHARDAWEDLFDVFRSEGVPPRTVIHCFTGGPADAEACLEFGCDISLSGVVTFKNAESLREAALLVPLERLHVETDSPFLAPVPHRGKPNEPAWVSVVGRFVADLRGDEESVFAAATSANTARLFAL